jgi:hypothetical protein
MTSPINNPIIKQLIDAGVIPQECTRFSFEANVKDVMRITAECFATGEQVKAIADALMSNPQVAKEIARTIIFRSQDGSSNESVSVEL